MAMTEQEAERILKQGNKKELIDLLVSGDKSSDRASAILARGRSRQRIMAGMAAEFGGAAAGGVAVGAMKHYGHEEALIPVAGGLTVYGAYRRTKKPEDEAGEFLFAAGSGMTAALLAVETESYLSKNQAA